MYSINSVDFLLKTNFGTKESTHSEKKVVPATRNLMTNGISTIYYKVVIRSINKFYELRKYSNINYNR